MNYQELQSYLNTDKFLETIKAISGDDTTKQKQRYNTLLDKAIEHFGDGDYHLLSSPGRTEIGGNHTDHQGGHVVAAALNIDNICIFKKTDDNMCTFIDDKFDDCIVDISNLNIVEEEKNTSNSLIRGVANRLNELGYKIGGFVAVCNSEVLIGSGISSSACFEIMIVEIFNSLYNQSKINPVERAIISKYAENVYFGKPCGLLDQLAISVGGFVAVDFKDANKPAIENFDFDFKDYGYNMVIVNTKGDHANLSHEYAAIPSEIKEVAKYFGKEILSQINPDDFFNKIAELRNVIKNDRAILRCIHFYNEDKRAIDEKNAIKNKDINELLKLMNESGNSSYMYLQNVYPASRPSEQSLAIGLAISQKVLGNNGAKRVHGGGFEGTIQAIVPNELLSEYKNEISKVFGEDAILILNIRPYGTKTIV